MQDFIARLIEESKRFLNERAIITSLAPICLI